MIKTVFFGTPQFAADIFKKLMEKGLVPVAIITGQDKKQGRGYRLAESPVKSIAKNVPVFQPANKEELKEVLSQLDFEVGLVIAYGMIFPEEVTQKYFLINLHGSLLPEFRGASPVQTALLQGKQDTGVSLIRISAELDAGDILAKRLVPIKFSDTSADLFEKMINPSVEMIVEQFNSPSGIWRSNPQEHSKATYTKKIVKEDGLVDLIRDCHLDIYNKYRAYYPWPGIYVMENNQRIKLLKLEYYNQKLHLLEVQQAGKKAVSYKDFLNSHAPLF